MTTCKLTTTLWCNLALLALAAHTLASPVQVVHNDTPQCDFLFIPNDLDEVGDFNVFPADEALAAVDLGQSPIIPCPLTNDPSIVDVLVEIRNLSGREWKEVWYVADPKTTTTNLNGEANEVPFSPLLEAFRIDNVVSDLLGTHHPLINESGTPDGIWEIGESWTFVLQDYTNALGLPASAITSLGVGNASTTPAAGIVESSGSIIAIAEKIPEPSGMAPALAALGWAGLLGARRRRTKEVRAPIEA